MKASELADVHFTGPVRLARGREVFTSVSWTQGTPTERHQDYGPSFLEPDPPANGAEPSKPKMVRLTRLKGKIGDCELVVRYVTPDTELEPVIQIVGLDDFQTAVVSDLRAPKGHEIECAALGLAASIGALATCPPPARGEDSTNESEYLVRLGDVCWHIAAAAYVFGCPLSELPQIDLPDLGLPALTGVSGEISRCTLAIVRDGKTTESERDSALKQCAIALSIVRTLIKRQESDLFAVMSLDISQRHARKPRKAGSPQQSSVR